MARIFEDLQRPPITTSPEIKYSSNRSASFESYRNPPITLPNSHYPIIDQFNNFLSQPPVPQTSFRGPLYGPYGELGQTTSPQVVEMKRYLAELPPTVSLEARAVFLTTFINKFHPNSISMQRHLPSFYDFGRDRYLAQDVYGGNGLYKATEEWFMLAKGTYPGRSEKVALPWLAMHIRHTLSRNSHMIENSSSLQTAVDIIMLFEHHFRKPNEDQGEYVERMSREYWDAHRDLRELDLLPGYSKAVIPITNGIRY